MSQNWFATCAPGLEEILRAEIRDLGGRKAKLATGGVEFDASNKAAYNVLYNLRTAHRLYLRVDEYRARDLPELYNKARRIPWERVIDASHRVRINAYSINSRETHTDKIAESTGYAIREHFEEELKVAAPEITTEGGEQLVMVRVEENRCTISLDASGELLFRRGWREHQGEAPLRESYAAAMLYGLEWSPDEALVDPMCGAGTIAIEAATMAAGRPPGSMREFQLQTWANFREDSWPEAPAPREGNPYIYASDRDAEVVQAAKTNVEAAGVKVHVDVHDVAELEPPAPSGLLIANAPYGVRLDDGAMESIHALCSTFETRFAGWRMGVLAHRDVTLPVKTSKATVVADFRNGGIPVRLWRVEHGEG